MSLVNQAKKLTDKKIISDNNNNNSNAIYRWKDAHGQWQYSDTAPSDQTAEPINVSGNLNSDLVEKMTPPPQEETSPTNTVSSIIPTTIAPDKISTLMKDAKNIQQLMDDRTSQLNQHLP
jgi:hypothetical protein